MPDPTCAPDPATPSPELQRIAKIFNGTYTVTSPTGDHRTFYIKTQPEDSKFSPGARIISLLTGPDNENDYQPFGFVTDNGINVWKSKRSTDPHARSDWEKFAAMVWSLAVNGEKSFFFQKGCRMLVEGRCIRCNRKLTHPESILSGIGPECGARRNKAKKKE